MRIALSHDGVESHVIAEARAKSLNFVELAGGLFGGHKAVMSELWLVSAPGDPKPEDTWTLIKDRTSSLSVNYKFHIPSELKVNQLSCIQ